MNNNAKKNYLVKLIFKSAETISLLVFVKFV